MTRQSKKRKPPKTIIGVISLHPRGFGFVRPENAGPDTKDIFIPKPFTMGAIDGDMVKVEVIDKKSTKGPEGKILAIIKRARTHLAGTILYRTNGVYEVYAPLIGLDRKVKLKKPEKKLKSGDRIIMKVTKWGHEIEGTLSEYIGHISNPSLDIKAAIQEFEIRQDFPKDIIEIIKDFPDTVQKEDLKNRTDFTKLTTLTIDPSTAKDFDDAISVTEKKGALELGVHIADVAHYVKQGSILDEEAFRRCNSTYFPGKCVPMLPEALSNGLCSLKPGVVRLTVSVIMQFNQNGDLKDYKIMRSYIKSKKRFSYEDALEVLEGKQKSPYLEELELMKKMGLLLKRKRLERGSIDFALPEAKVVVSKKEVPLRIEFSEYDITHQMIEEFMLKANEMVAISLKEKGAGLIYRIHEEPNQDSFEDFYHLARVLGFTLPQKPKNTDIQKLFEKAKTSPYLHRLSVAFIRSMKLACYSPDNIGHYGLKLEHYLHFTSPIRRYADLIIQRLLFNEASDLNLNQISTKISEKERVSMKAEQSVVRLKKLRLLKKSFKKDPYKTYPATITRVKPFALIFELDDYFIEGVLHVSEIGDDYYLYDPTESRFIGERTKETFAFGGKIEVMIRSMDLIIQEVKFDRIP